MNKKMLIVDDEHMNREILETVFEDSFELRLVDSGEAALEMLSEFKPDIVLLDVMMGGIDGYEVCRRIKNNSEYVSAIVVLISARAHDEDKKTGFDAGANYYVTKPFTLDEVRKVVDDAFAI